MLTTRQTGAEFAPLHLSSAGLFSADIHTLYEQLAMQVWMCHGDRGDSTNYRSKVIVQNHPNWQFSVFLAGAPPYFELPERFSARYDAFRAAAKVGTGG